MEEMAPPISSRPIRRWAIATTLFLVALGLVAPASNAARTAPAARAASPGAVAPFAPSPSHEAEFVARINSLRASKGLSQLQSHSQLQSVARNWTERMVQNGQISHNPNLGSQVEGNWTKLGENVGVGYDVDGLMQAFINSSAHYKNLVDPAWNYVGVGVTIAGDGRMYTTHNFMAMGSSAPPPPPPSSPPTTRRSSATTQPPPAPTTTTTTAPPPPPQPHPTPERVTAVLEPLRSLEQT
jgi:uncharacterized protein YkwD